MAKQSLIWFAIFGRRPDEDIAKQNEKSNSQTINNNNKNNKRKKMVIFHSENYLVKAIFVSNYMSGCTRARKFLHATTTI